MTKQLVQRVLKLLEESGGTRQPGAPLPSAEQVASRLQAKWHDLSRTSQAKLVKQLKDTVLPEVLRSERERNNAALGPDTKKRRREDDYHHPEFKHLIRASSQFVRQRTGAASLSSVKGGQACCSIA